MRYGMTFSSVIAAIVAIVVTAASITLAIARGRAIPKNGKNGTPQRDRNRLSDSQRELLRGLEKQALQYFLENQLPNGMILDRQRNSGQLDFTRQISTSATGMGLIAIAVASSPENNLIDRGEAIRRVKKALDTSLKLTQTHGLMPHFLDPKTLAPLGSDRVSTIDSTWLIAGALWSAAYLDDAQLKDLARQLYDRVDWQYFTPAGTDDTPLAMGLDEKGDRINATYDRFNAEVAFMYMLAIGAPKNALQPSVWTKLKPYYRDVNGVQLASGDLGLFAFQYSNTLFDFSRLKVGGQIDLSAESVKAVQANFDTCRKDSKQFGTFDYFWGLSAGDGPGDKPGDSDAYRAYSPLSEVDGTAHITATLASIQVNPDLVMQNVQAAESGVVKGIRGRYGYSNVNLARHWISSDVVGIDLGAAVMALENALNGDRTQKVFESLPMIRTAVDRLNGLNSK